MRRQARALAAARGTPEQVLAEERATLEGVFVMKPQCLYMSFAPSYTQSYIEVRTTGVPECTSAYLSVHRST